MTFSPYKATTCNGSFCQHTLWLNAFIYHRLNLCDYMSLGHFIAFIELIVRTVAIIEPKFSEKSGCLKAHTKNDAYDYWYLLCQNCDCRSLSTEGKQRRGALQQTPQLKTHQILRMRRRRLASVGQTTSRESSAAIWTVPPSSRATFRAFRVYTDQVSHCHVPCCAGSLLKTVPYCYNWVARNVISL